jgi:3'-5' exoribonuclease
MKEHFIAQLTVESLVRTTFLVQSKERKIARSGSAYLDVDLRDSSGVIRAKLWDSDRQALDFEVDDVVRIEGDVEDFQGTLQLRIRRISKCADESVNLLDYLPRTSHDPDVMFAALFDRVRGMPEGPLRALVVSVLEDPRIAEKFKLAPAATSYHHAYLGGLLEHVTSLVELGDRIADHYPSLDRNLMVAGLVLHDLGKIEELNFRRGFHYSTRGQLVGHMAIGLELLRDKMRSLADFPADLKNRIEHIILSHHGKLEFGSPKEPMFPEALVVHCLDDLDSKLESMRAQYAVDKDREGHWTARNRALGRELLKGVAHDPS